MKSKDGKKSKEKFEYKQIKDLIVKESQYIDELFNMLSIPPSAMRDAYDELYLTDASKNKDETIAHNETVRAKSFEELKARFEAIKGKKKQGYNEKLLKKNLKTRMKKKSKQELKNANKKLVRPQKSVDIVKTIDQTEKKFKPVKPVFNSEGKMVFSKFDFSNLGQKKEKKLEQNPKKILENMHKDEQHYKELQESGESEKVQQIKEKKAWQNAIAKAGGKKVKDDPELLKKSLKKQKQIKLHSKKKWTARIEGVKKAGEDRQKKRTENIEKRQKSKKTKKMKQLVQRGKVIPGF